MTDEKLSEVEEATLAGAHALVREGRHAAALVLLGELLARRPDHQLGLCVSLLSLMGLGRHQEALDRARLVHEPEYLPWCQVTQTDALIELGRYADARDVARQWEQTQPGTLGPVLRLARIALLSGDTDAALAHAERAARTDPTSVPAMTLLARVRIARGDTSAARWVLSRALKLEPGNVRARELWEAVRPGAWSA